jgi:two-component system, response regulator
MSEKTILLVEDNPDDEALTLHALDQYKLSNQVVVARNGVEALDYLFATGPHAGRDPDCLPTVVLLDLKLPKIDGLEVLRRIRANDHTRLLPVVLLTSSNQEEDRIRGYTLGANSYVRKPVDFDSFVHAAGQLGLYWILLNQPPKD